MPVPRRRIRIALIALALLALLAACTSQPLAQTAAAVTSPTEVAVTLIPLTEPASRASSEISGMAWFDDDWLVLLPQYPGRIERGGQGSLLALARADLTAFLDGSLDGPLDPRRVPIDQAGLPDSIHGFQGFEAIAFDGQTAYLTIEAAGGLRMEGYIVRGEVSGDLESIRLLPDSLQPIDPQAGIANQTDETILLAGGEVLTFYESNGAEVNPEPQAHRFTPDLEPLGSLPFPSIEYRITDATPPDAGGRFWAINYFFPGDRKLAADADPLAQEWGLGATHSLLPVVERLVEMQWSPDGISLVDQPPLYLKLETATGRNWEGIARLDGRGFLLVTDKFPETILGFVEWSD